MVPERREARPKQVDVRGDVVEEVRDVLLVDVADAVLLDPRVPGRVEPPPQVVERGLARHRRERVVLVAGLPAIPGRSGRARQPSAECSKRRTMTIGPSA